LFLSLRTCVDGMYAVLSRATIHAQDVSPQGRRQPGRDLWTITILVLHVHSRQDLYLVQASG
jgi:hypothetical protein